MYLPISVADDFVDACVDASLAIVGIEGFQVEGELLRPDLNLIADFSSIVDERKEWDCRVRSSQVAARRFVELLRLEGNDLARTIHEELGVVGFLAAISA